MNRVLLGVCVVQFLAGSVLSTYALASTASNKEVQVAAQREWGEAVQGRALSISTQKARYAPEEPISLSILLKNAGTNEIQMESISPFAAYYIEVVGPDGKNTPPTVYGKKLFAYLVGSWGSQGPSRKLKPGAELPVEMRIARLFDFSLPGKYTISVQKAIAGRITYTNTLNAVSNKITLTIDDSLATKP